MTDQTSDDQDLMPVRVVYRQLDYVTTGPNPVGDIVDIIVTAYGPGMPQNDPLLQPGLDVESQEYADKASDFRFGELIHLRKHQYVGLIASGAVRDVKVDQDGEEEEEELLDVHTATADQLALWIQQEHPTVNDVVRASEGDPEVAKKLLEAESLATDGEPRKGVIEGLTAVVSRG